MTAFLVSASRMPLSKLVVATLVVAATGLETSRPQKPRLSAGGGLVRPAVDEAGVRQRAALPRSELVASSFLESDLFLKKIVPTFGALLANIMFLSPMKAVLEARKTGVLGDLNPIPLVAIAGNTAAWLGYSIATKDIFVMAANLPGLLMGFFYTMSAVAASTGGTRSMIEFLLLAYAGVVGAAGYLASTGVIGSATAVFGVLANTLLLLFYSSPLSALANVIASRSAATISAPLTLTSLCNGALWTTYGLANKDWALYVPNGVGVVLSLVQLFLLAIF